MKRSELERNLNKKGAKFFKNRGNHDFWKSKDGIILIVPRGSKINEFTER